MWDWLAENSISLFCLTLILTNMILMGFHIRISKIELGKPE